MSRAGVQSLSNGLRAPAWGLLDQAIYSGTNFAATVVVARVLGVAEFGAFALAMSVAATVWVLGRALFCDPFTIRASGLPPADWSREASLASGAVLVAGLLVAGGLALTAIAFPSQSAVIDSLLVLAAFVPVLLLQDFWRVAAFSSGRSGLAIMNDAAWAIVQLGAFAAIWSLDILSAPAALAAWGLGAVGGCVVAQWQFRVTPALGAQTFQWAREALALGGWFGAGRAAQAAGAQGVFIIVGALAGLAAVGGLRSVYALFGPLTVVLRGAEMTALPSMSRSGKADLDTLVRRYFVVLFVFGAAYAGALVVAGSGLLGAVFGPDFGRYSDLLLPIALAHVGIACGLGAHVALRAMARARQLFDVEVAALVTTIGAALALTSAAGVSGGAWAICLGGIVYGAGPWWLLLQSDMALRRPRWTGAKQGMDS